MAECGLFMLLVEEMMSQDQWNAVDNYFNELFAPSDPSLDAALKAVAEAGMPQISVSPMQGKLLHLLARACHARKILEIGTLGGYSTIWLGRALPPDGKLITLEIDPAHAAVARANIERAGLAEAVEVRVGPAMASLPKLVESGAGPFDLVFIDADKQSTPDYLTWSLRLTKPGSLIIIDNVVRNGGVSDPTSRDTSVQGTRRSLAALAEDPRVVVTALQTVGSKGYDGLAIALVTGA
jgi:predicted O-methyltransferase YrrM